MNTPTLMGGALKAIRPWLLIGGIGAVGAGILGWAGVFGGDDGAPDSVAVSGATSAANYYDCPDGEVQGMFHADDRVLAVARADGGWVGVRDPENLTLTVWLAEASLTPDSGQPPIGDLPEGGCPDADVLPAGEVAMSARVRDSRTGEPLEGVTVQLTDGSGIDSAGMSTLTDAEGRFSVSGELGEEIGLRIDGNDIGYQRGFVGGGSPTRFGFRVVTSWGEASVWSPRDLGDIALDPAFVEGVVRDSVTGAPVVGAFVNVTDVPAITETPTPLPGLSATTGVDGSFRIEGIFDREELGLSIDGAPVGYETGFLGGSGSSPFGLPVANTFAAASTWPTGDLGDIALDPLGATPTTTTSTSPTATTTTTPPGTTTPGTTTPATTTPATTVPPQNLAPSINSLSANPSPIYGGQGCSPASSTITVSVTDASGIASVTVGWSMPTEVSGTKTGAITLTGPSGGGTWTGTISGLPDPPPAGTAVSLTVTARDPQGLVTTRVFPQSLIAQYCLG